MARLHAECRFSYASQADPVLPYVLAPLRVTAVEPSPTLGEAYCSKRTVRGDAYHFAAKAGGSPIRIEGPSAVAIMYPLWRVFVTQRTLACPISWEFASRRGLGPNCPASSVADSSAERCK